PDGRRLAITNSSVPSVWVLDLDRGAVVTTYATESGTAGVAWRGDGRLLAAGGSDQRIYVWDDAQKRLQSILDGHQGFVVELTFTHGDDLLVSSAWDGTTRVWEPVRGNLLVTTPVAGCRLRV